MRSASNRNLCTEDLSPADARPPLEIMDTDLQEILYRDPDYEGSDHGGEQAQQADDM